MSDIVVLCSYGCGNASLYILKNGKNCCSKSPCSCPANRTKNSIGLQQAYINGNKQSAFTNKDRQKSIDGKKQKVIDDFNTNNTYRSNTYLKSIILEYKLLEYKCSNCNISTWNDNPLTLDLDHINGDAHNCKLDNLRFLCPNCHSQTSTFKGKNKNAGHIKVTDDQLKNALQNCSSIRQALISVGLAPKGGNYSRAYKLQF